MFTGIIQATGKLKKSNNKTIIEMIDNNFDMKIGDSISVDGICLTVKEISGKSFTVDNSEETLKKTTLGEKTSSNSVVNLEPALRISDRLGGHIVSGHVDGLGQVVSINELDQSWIISIRWIDKNYSRYIVHKGSICVNGISLTIADHEGNGEIFKIAIIPHTWQNTNLQYLTQGSLVNLEADALVKYVERLLISNKDKQIQSDLISSDWLKENGW